jgi:hypothetical protein
MIDLFRPLANHPVELRPKASAAAYELACNAHSASNRQMRYLLQELDRQFPALPLPLGTISPLVIVAYDCISHMPRASGSASPESTTTSASSTFSPHQSPPISAMSSFESDETYYFCLCLRILRRMCEPFGITRSIMLALFQVARRQRVELPVGQEHINLSQHVKY